MGFSGLMIDIKENHSRMPTAQSVKNLIANKFRVNPSEFMTYRECTMMHRETRLTFQDSQVSLHDRLIRIVCKRPFTNVVMKISYKDGVLVVSLRNKNVEEEF